MWKNQAFTPTWKISWKQLILWFCTNTLISRNFCVILMRVNLCNFHTVPRCVYLVRTTCPFIIIPHLYHRRRRLILLELLPKKPTALSLPSHFSSCTTVWKFRNFTLKTFLQKIPWNQRFTNYLWIRETYSIIIGFHEKFFQVNFWFFHTVTCII